MSSLPENGASACQIPDPQEREPLLIANCAKCGQPIHDGDEEAFYVISGEFFCSDQCRHEYDERRGVITPVCLMGRDG